MPSLHPGTQASLLVVDPNPLTWRRVEEALADTGVELLQARDAEQAIEVAQERDVAVLLASTALPRGTGYDLAIAVREIHPDVGVILMAGGFEVYNEARAQAAGVDRKLSKPFTGASLRAQVEAVLAERLSGPAVARVAAGTPVGSATSVNPEPPALQDIEPVAISLSDADLEPISADDLLHPLPGDEARAPPPQSEVRSEPYRPPTSAERVATFLPRDYADLPRVSVDPAVVGPALEAAILQVLPEVVETVLRRSLQSSPAFRELVAGAVEQTVRANLPALARQAMAEHLDREREG